MPAYEQNGNACDEYETLTTPEAHQVTRSALLQDAPKLARYLHKSLSSTQSAIEGSIKAPTMRAAAVLAPLYAVSGRPHLLFTVRSPDLGSHRGEISFPGGSRDPQDISLEQTALRESHEELDIAPERVEVLGQLPPVLVTVSNFLITPFVGWLGEGIPRLSPNPAEVAEVIEAPLEALADEAIYHTEIWERAGQTHTIHFYDFGPYRIWGATARVLYTLLALLPTE